jgi:hypothetical protein
MLQQPQPQQQQQLLEPNSQQLLHPKPVEILTVTAAATSQAIANSNRT